MGRMRFSYFFGLFIGLLSLAIIVHGQSQDPSTTSTENSEQAQGTSELSGSSSETSPSTELYSSYFTSTPSAAGSVTTNELLSDCKTPADLKIYCANSLNPAEMEFFRNDTSIIGVLTKILRPRTIYALQEQCKPGDWCLATSYEKELSDSINQFYTTPICQSDRLWMCLEDIQIKRRECNESELIFLMSAIGLMCDMYAINGKSINTQCFTQSLKALHVVYSDISRKVQDESADSCSSYNKQMTNMYACAVESCTREQQVFLEDFGPWSFISSNAESILELCGVTLDCQDGSETKSAPAPGSANPQNPSTSPTSTNIDQTSESIADMEEKIFDEEVSEIKAVIAAEEAIGEMESELFESTTSYMQTTAGQGLESESENPIVNEQGMDIPVNPEDVDQTFVYGMVTVTVVVVISLTLMGVMAFKRFSRLRKNYKMGYSQMTDEESRMLRNEYN